MRFRLQKKHHFKIKRLLKWKQHTVTFLLMKHANVSCQNLISGATNGMSSNFSYLVSLFSGKLIQLNRDWGGMSRIILDVSILVDS